MEGVEEEKREAVPAELCQSCALAQRCELEEQKIASGLNSTREEALRRALSKG